MYARLAITEEVEMRKQFGAEFEDYAAKTPRFLPSLRKRLSAT
jgi:protein-S-isoprenylcysteine O-methyltransferase Ste14